MKRSKDLTKILKILPEFKTALLADEKLRKMLAYESTDALSKDAPTIASVSDFIILRPLAESGIRNFGKHTYIIIDIDLIDLDTSDDNAITASIDIAVISQFDTWVLDEDKVRVLEICNRVVNAIDSKKFTMSGEADVWEIRRVTIDKQSTSYVCRVLVSDDAAKVGF
jgi:hypothetical protein